MGGEREAGRNFDGFFFLRFPLSAAAGGEMFFRRSPFPPPPFGKQLSARSRRRGEQEKSTESLINRVRHIPYVRGIQGITE